MKKIIHVGILSVGLMLSNAALADEFADMRNSPNNMTAEQAERVEAGAWGPVVKRIGGPAVKWAKQTWGNSQKNKVKENTASFVKGAYYGYQASEMMKGSSQDNR